MRNLFNLDSPIMRGLARLCDLMWLNILTIICCIPIITIGPAITALYYMTMKILRGEEGYLTKPYFQAFRDNLKQGILLWLLIVAVGSLLVVDFVIVIAMQTPYQRVLLVALTMLTMLFVTIIMYLFPLQARFENTCRATLKNAFLLALTQLPKTILMVLIHLSPFAITYFVPYIAPLIILLGIALPAYGCSYLLVAIFKKIEESQMGDAVESEQLEENLVDEE